MKILLFIFILTSFVFAQQLNYTHGYTTAGVNDDGQFTSLDSTGATSYSVVFLLDDYYPFDFNPSVYDSVTAIGSSDKTSIGALWYFIDADEATDSTNIDVDVYTGVYGDANRTVAGIKWDGTATNCADVTGDGDLCSGVLIYTETGKLLPPHAIKITFDVDPTAAEVSAGLDLYFEFVYPAVYQSAKEKKVQTYENQNAGN